MSANTNFTDANSLSEDQANAFWKSVMQIPMLRYMKAPADSISELYERYPQPSGYAFAYVSAENAFYAYNPTTDKWAVVGATTDLQKLMSIDSSLLADGDILIYNKEDGTFNAKSGSVWNSLLGSNNVQVTRFLNEVSTMPTAESTTGVYFVHNSDQTALCLVVNNAVHTLFDSTTYYTKTQTEQLITDTQTLIANTEKEINETISQNKTEAENLVQSATNSLNERINQLQNVSVRKIYDSHAIMLADNSYEDDFNGTLAEGQLVLISTDETHNNQSTIWSFKGQEHYPNAFTYLSTLGDLTVYAKTTELSQVKEQAKSDYLSLTELISETHERADEAYLKAEAVEAGVPIRHITVNGEEVQPDENKSVNIETGLGNLKGVILNGVEQEVNSENKVVMTVKETTVDTSVSATSTNAVSSQAVAQKFSELSDIYATAISLTETGEEGDKKYSISLLNEAGQAISTTEEFSAGGGSGSGSGTTTASTKIVLTKISGNITAKQGETVRVKFSYDHIDTTSLDSTGTAGTATITYIAGGSSTTETRTISAGSLTELDVTDTVSTGANTVRIKVTALSESGTTQVATISFSINVVSLTLTSSLDYAQVFTPQSTVNVPYYLVGSGTKRLLLYLNGSVFNTREITASTSQGTFSVPLTGLAHGNARIQIVAELDITSGTIRSNSICWDLIVNGSLSTPLCAMRFDYADGTILAKNQTPYIDCTQFQPFVVRYGAWNPETSVQTVTVRVGSSVVSRAKVSLKATTITARTAVAGTLACAIEMQGATYAFSLNSSDSGTGLTEPTDNLQLKLATTGRSNDDSDKTSWTDDTHAITATLSDFLFGTDGWTDGALRFSAGGKLTVPYQPLSSENQKTEGSFAFATKILINSTANDNASLLSCVDSSGTGFQITASQARITSKGGTSTSMALTTGETYHIAFVGYPTATSDSSDHESLNTRMVYLYINGIQCGAMQLAVGDSMYQSTPANITAGNEEADFSLYSLRFYNNYLDDSAVLNLYLTEMDDADELVETFNSNDLLDDEGTITPANLPDDARYIIVTGTADNGEATLLQAAVENNKKTKYDVTEILHIKRSEPSLNFRIDGGCISLQGTSSLAYPIKNYRIYTKNTLKEVSPLYIGTDNNGSGGTLDESGLISFKVTADGGKKPAPVNCFCLKADYAESSSSHNTGVARLANEVLKEVGAYTPAQENVNSSYEYDVRTTVDGEPCYLFYRTTKTATPVFMGKYNMNNDKSTEAVFGFLDIPGYHDADWVTSNFNGENPTQCWEFLNNDYPMGLFQDDDFTSTVEKSGKEVPAWSLVFEGRFPDECEDTTYLAPLVKWVKSTDGDTAKFKEEVSNYFDLEYLCHYYNLTEIFGAVDQRVKNMMLGFWYNTKVEKMLGYFIFYDNDTVFGVRNDGRLKYSWDIDHDTIDAELSTSDSTVYAFAGHNSVLWKNLREACADELESSYKTLRTKLTYDKMLQYLDTYQSDKFVERIYNLDAQYKYVKPLTQGIKVKESGVEVTKTYSYLESLQGSRRSHRHWWIKNRLALLDAKYGTGSYTITDLSWKGYSSAGATISAEANRKFYLELRRENTAMKRTEVSEGETWSYSYPNEANIGTIFHFYGGQYCSKIDLSSWGGFQDLNIPTLPSLKELVLGKEGSTYTISSLALADKMPMLETLVVKNYTSITSLDLSGLNRLKSLDATGCSSLTNIGIEQGSPITELKLPSSLTALRLRSLSKLTNDGITFDGTPSVTALTVENCDNVDWTSLLATLTNVTHLRVSIGEKRGGTAYLEKYQNYGGVTSDGSLTTTCRLLGTYTLTTYLDAEDYKALQEKFPELEIVLPQYSRYTLHMQVASPSCITNDDNDTGYIAGTTIQNNPYVLSGHLKTICGKFKRVLGKRTEENVMTTIQLDDTDSSKYFDGTEAVTTGAQGDVYVHVPHFWYKGLTDVRNNKLYICYSSNTECPDTVIGNTVAVLYEKDALNVKDGQYINASATTETDALLTSSSKMTKCSKFTIPTDKKYTLVRFPTMPQQNTDTTYTETLVNIGAIFTDEEGNVVGNKISESTEVTPGMYTFANIPESAVYIWISYPNAEEFCPDFKLVFGTADTPMEDYEPDWVEATEYLTNAFNLIKDTDGKYKSVSGIASIPTGNSMSEYTNPWSEEIAKRSWNAIGFERNKNLAWLILLKTGRTDVLNKIGQGSSVVGNSLSWGMRETLTNDDYSDKTLTGYSVANSLGDGTVWQQTTDKHQNILGIENLHIGSTGNVWIAENETPYYMMDADGGTLVSHYVPLGDGTYRFIPYSVGNTYDHYGNSVYSISKNIWATRIVGGKYLDIFTAPNTVAGSTNTYLSTYDCSSMSQGYNRTLYRYVYTSTSSLPIYKSYGTYGSAGFFTCYTRGAISLYKESSNWSTTNARIRMAFTGTITELTDVSAYEAKTNII